jgi:hypothetical protein
VIPLRYALNLYTARRQRDDYANRVMRESTTLRAAEDVWSDVASSLGLGFRSADAGPLLYGDLASGAALEIGVLETIEDGTYRTVAKARGESNAKGRILVRPHDPLTRLARRVLAPPPGIDEAWLERFFVRAKPPEIARERLTASTLDLLVALADRVPHLYWEDGEVALVLEGVELVHERLERIIDALTAMTDGGASAQPFRD